MENSNVVNCVQETPLSFADSDVRNTHSSVCGLNSNRSPSSNPNGVSGYSGNTRSSLKPGSVELLASFMQDIQNIGHANSEIVRNCETRWIQLLRLVEKQCQEQINAQQEQFHHQIQLIQDEIKELVSLQSSTWARSRAVPAPLSHSFPSLPSPMGMCSEAFEEQGSLVSQLRSAEGEGQPEASGVQQECAGSEASMNSGYGSLSASELSPGLRGPDQRELAAKKPQENRSPGRRDSLVFPAGLEHKADEDHQCGKKASKSLTSWAQKLKQTQPKRVTADEVCVNSMQENERVKRLPLENTNLTDAALPPYTFYLNQPKESPNSVVSEASGLSYWKLDEKEMYHTLPENFRSELPDVFSKSTTSTKVPPVQLSSADEGKLSSLKEIYHKRQRENKQMPDQSFMPSSQPSHPPEILTLDPTLHMKPGQQNQGLCFFRTPADSAPFSPDSMAEPGFPSHCDTDSFSQTSHSSQLDDSPTPPASSRAVHLDLWRNHPFQGENRASSPFPVAYRDADNDNSVNTEEEEILTLTPSSVTQCADSSLPDYSLSVASLEDPVVMSKIRQNLREKHARHIADLRAYYDSEIQSLKQQLECSQRTAASEELKKINQSLADRCDQLDSALNEASAHIKALENKNNQLEKQVADWRERFYALSDNSKALQERLEEMRASHKEKDNTISRLQSRLRELEEAFEKAYKLSDNKNTRLQEENKMFQNLLGEYESLGKEHERVKDTLNTTENKLLDANTEISDLKRTILKLEAQLKQVEHENALKLRHISENRLRTPCANKLGTPDVSRRKWLIPGAEYSIFTGQPLEGQESPKDNRLEETYIPSRHHSPPEKDSSQEDSSTNTIEKKENEISEAPIIKAFKELEEGKIVKDWGTQTEKEDAPAKPSTRRQTVGFVEPSVAANRSPEKGRDQHRPKRFSSPSGQRSSSLPPANRKSSTPTRREIMLAPVSVTYSPKRSPKENLSPGFSHLLSRSENTVTRFDILLDDLETGATSTLQHNNPRKRLQFHSLDDVEGRQHSGATHSSSNGMKKAAAWEERNQRHEAVQSPCEEDFKYTARIPTLAETERLFDELTHEKQQIEAALSRIPCSGGRMTLQARLNQEALEDRLETINRDLGLIRMTLKRFHVLRTSANL
ncbi:M-phase phosphoprotein 9 isoform X1 [Onychostruthus taczanowskii]|uniref:M-phase phosphoprotein 9 isoform X1 n=2 Tax=Onychostruthus taczanowskii TaxID=356909 RepID=UPI001B803724|nr:M-phase phosphoprotein 9 isoform X1 [Onychostruthus taczanowskii]XP_041266001.1 M-phase phosphoprotein 9 isoform X1 [Onychostruthus taczanowskii]XP_041266003.1 M-phase phosphoprotein 9 isoform X1 [Onychostruthus taczanowskii]XP_041266004.1 M-phase phosphoprotein 9 isoform X1 [Onychostruthus taczanowskii]